ncbi:unnamed protein product [Prunus armeniaca]|uniref:Transmembrane protein n=1 Tax=Prunus armeniaca TaxID=36596 RepID=A0A6J5XE31_PRUAR|nr:unnamed protein product [Prunus armeniaca]
MDHDIVLFFIIIILVSLSTTILTVDTLSFGSQSPRQRSKAQRVSVNVNYLNTKFWIDGLQMDVGH